MPDFSDSLPQIAPEKNVPQAPSQPVAPVMPTVVNDLSRQEHVALGGQRNGLLKSRLPIKQLIVFFILLAIIVASYLIYFVFIPNTQVKSYIEQTSADIGKISEKLNSASNSELDVRETSLEISEGVYFDVLQTLVFVHSTAFIDAKEDLDKIKSIQLAIADARTGREKFRIADEVKEFDRLYKEYLDKLEDGANRLYIFENFRVNILSAIGDEQSRENEKLLEVYVESTPREQKLDFVNKLEELTRQSTDRLKLLSPVPDDSRVFYEQIVASYDDMTATLGAMKISYEAGNAEGDGAAIVKLSEFGKRQVERYGRVQSENFNFLQNFKHATFEEVLLLEDKINSELERLN